MELWSVGALQSQVGDMLSSLKAMTWCLVLAATRDRHIGRFYRPVPPTFTGDWQRRTQSPQLKAVLIWVPGTFVITPPGEKIEARDVPLGFEQSQDLEFARAMAICENKPKSKLRFTPHEP